MPQRNAEYNDTEAMAWPVRVAALSQLMPAMLVKQLTCEFIKNAWPVITAKPTATTNFVELSSKTTKNAHADEAKEIKASNSKEIAQIVAVQ